MTSDAQGFPGSVCVVQLTDSHLFADAQQRLLGIDTLASLNAVVDQVLVEQPRIDLVLATGDIAQDASPQAYHSFIRTVGRIPAPCCWIPGNHDDATLMAEIGDAQGLNRDWVDVGAWRIVMLDSSAAGSVSGVLEQPQLLQLDRALDSAGERHLLLCLHHHPVPIGSAWMEPLGLQNADRLWQRLDAEPRVRAVLWGHIHQQLEQQRESVRLLASPSTCVQFAAGSSDFATDQQAPGYRWLRLHDDGRMETGVSRLAPGSFPPEAGASGY